MNEFEQKVNLLEKEKEKMKEKMKDAKYSPEPNTRHVWNKRHVWKK